jgi:hypothetical protein
MGLISWLFGMGEQDGDDKKQEYNVCEEHGHDFREPEYEEHEAEFTEITSRHYSKMLGIDRSEVPGTVIGICTLNKIGFMPCRDCPEEGADPKAEKLWLVYEKNGKLATITMEEHEKAKT